MTTQYQRQADLQKQIDDLEIKAKISKENELRLEQEAEQQKQVAQ